MARADNTLETLQLKLERLDAEQRGCVDCGLCLAVCPTFQATGWEQEGPRGRISLARSLMDGRIDPRSTAFNVFEACQGCGLCEKACPLDMRFSLLRDLVADVRNLAISFELLK